jgi:Domain of unknown function (DUF5615)
MTHDADRETVPLVLDEMLAPTIADALRDKGYDVVAVAAEPNLRAMTDDEVYAWAASHGRCIVTENVKDFRPILARVEEAGGRVAPLLLTSSRTFPRTRRNPGPLITALDARLRGTGPVLASVEQWLLPA